MAKKRPRAGFRTVDLSSFRNWPNGKATAEWWRTLEQEVENYPEGKQLSWGIPFALSKGSAAKVVMLTADQMLEIPIQAKADYLCFLHDWRQLPDTIKQEDPCEGLVTAEYVLHFNDGTAHVQPIRARFEVNMEESPGPPWLAQPFGMWETIDPTLPTGDMSWGRVQYGIKMPNDSPRHRLPLIYALANPEPALPIRALVIRCLTPSPLLVTGLTLYSGTSHPLRHLPRRTFRLTNGQQPIDFEKPKVDLGVVARTEHTSGMRNETWLSSPHTGTRTEEPSQGGEDLLEIVGAEDATLSVNIDGKKARFSVGEAFHDGKSQAGEARLEVLGKQRQWVTVKVIDSSTGKPTPVRIHLSGSHGEYLAPYGHHTQVNANWFEDYGADLVVAGRNFAYVPGEFSTDLPTGEIYVELYKGFEYKPLRRRVSLKPDQTTIEFQIERWKNLRERGWVTADTHVHFLSPHTAWLEAQAEGVNVVNLLASQWGRLFTNVGDLTGRPGVVENDTIVFVGTENRNHMLGHMSMLGTQGPYPVFPMCAGGPTEAWVGDPDFRTLAEWALENRRKGGVVIRPHYPYCGHTEDPVPILKGLVDALEIGGLRGTDFATQEWYRYLNCGYRVAVAGGTDKMGAYTALGWLRTYALINGEQPFTYASWGDAVRAGRTVATNGPLLSLTVEGQSIGDTIDLPSSGGSLHIAALAESAWPIARLEVVFNGRVVASASNEQATSVLHINQTLQVPGSGWIAARCCGAEDHPAGYMAAHTSPVYIRCGNSRIFNGPAAEHMLALVEGGIEYLNTLATVYDEASRRRMVKLFLEAREELQGRLVVEAAHHRHAPEDRYHSHGHSVSPDHRH